MAMFSIHVIAHVTVFVSFRFPVLLRIMHSFVGLVRFGSYGNPFYSCDFPRDRPAGRHGFLFSDMAAVVDCATLKAEMDSNDFSKDEETAAKRKLQHFSKPMTQQNF